MEKYMYKKSFLGIGMAQNDYAVSTFDIFIDKILNEYGKNKIGRIIELGTASGGLSILLHLSGLINKYSFITYDIVNNVAYKDIFNKLSIDFRVKNIFENEDEIANLIKSDGITILLCDNGNKIKEFNLFSKYLKNDDFIMAHDYSISAKYFAEKIKNNYWDWCEINYSDIENSINSYNLLPYMSEDWQKAVWCCFQKKN